MFLAHLKTAPVSVVSSVPGRSVCQNVNPFDSDDVFPGSVVVETVDNAGGRDVCQNVNPWETVETSTEPAPAPPVAELIVKPKPATRNRVAGIVRVEPVVASTVEPFAEYPETASVETLQPLRGTGRSGDFVHNTQKMDERFRNVSRGWTERADNPDDTSVMTWDAALEQLERERGETRDIVQSYGSLRVVNDVAGVALLDDNGTRLTFTENSLDQFAYWIDSGLTLPRRLINGDADDKATLAAVIKNGLRKLEDKNGLIRLRNDGTVRAFLSEQYAILDNRWFLDVIRSILPEGLVSHWRSDSGDSVYFNVLIPDSMRQETDSEYGGMLACGNGETGSRKLSTCPSVFRAICRNGCIWDETKGTGIIERVHRGAIDLNALAARIRDNLNRQIPLLGDGIDRMLLTRSYVSDVGAVPAIGSVLRSLRIPGITRETSDAIFSAFGEQRTETARVTAFDVIQGLTKSAQSFSAGLQETVERAAGSAMLWNADRWNNVFESAKTLSAEELKTVFKTVS